MTLLLTALLLVLALTVLTRATRRTLTGEGQQMSPARVKIKP